jgi:hypothetical protein
LAMNSARESKPKDFFADRRKTPVFVEGKVQTELEDRSFSTTRISTLFPGKRRSASRKASLLASVWLDAST